MPWLLANWRLVAYAALLAAIVSGGLIWHHSVFEAGRDAQRAEDRVAYDKAVAAAQQQEAKWREQRDAAQQSYEQALEALRAATAGKPNPLIVCHKPAPSSSVPGAGPSPGKPDGAATGSGVVPSDARLDTGALYSLVDRADRLSEQLRALEAACR